MNDVGQQQVGVVFDIDGVLLCGGEAIPGAAKAVSAIADTNIPYIFVTNGGGVPERVKADVLTSALALPPSSPLTSAERILLSSTPMAGLVPDLKDARILVVGRGSSSFVTSVLAKYGYTNLIAVDDYMAKYPFLVPQWTSNPSLMAADSSSSSSSSSQNPQEDNPPVDDVDDVNQVVDPEDYIDAVMVIHEPSNWGPVLQTLLDVVLSVSGNPGVRRKDWEDNPQTSIPVYVANPDLAYSDTFCVPRITSGSFITCLQSLVSANTGGKAELDVTFFGKPQPLTYEYAQSMLNDLAGGAEFDAIYAIGDNPRSDIAGANAAGPPWTSILVRTGNFNDPAAENSSLHPAHHVFPSVVEAVDFILQHRE